MGLLIIRILFLFKTDLFLSDIIIFLRVETKFFFFPHRVDKIEILRISLFSDQSLNLKASNAAFN